MDTNNATPNLYMRIIEMLVAAGIVTAEKIQEAKDIAQSIADASVRSTPPPVIVKVGVKKWFGHRAYFTIGVQTFHIRKSESKVHAEWVAGSLKTAFENFQKQTLESVGNPPALAGSAPASTTEFVPYPATIRNRNVPTLTYDCIVMERPILFEGREWTPVIIKGKPPELIENGRYYYIEIKTETI